MLIGGKELPALAEAGGRRAPSMADSLSVVKDYDAAWNAHDVEGVLAFFTDDAVVRMEPSPPDDEFGGVYSGKEQIRAGFVEPLMAGFHVDSNDDYRVAEDQEGGQRVTWSAMLSADLFRQMGAEPPVEATGEAVLEGDKFKSFTAIARLPEARSSS
jgi:ketosteroid isomerase-like protein